MGRVELAAHELLSSQEEAAVVVWSYILAWKKVSLGKLTL